MFNNSDVRRVRINYHQSNGMVYHLVFYDKNGTQIAQIGNTNGGSTKDINLTENERIIGFKSRCNAGTSWYMYDLQFFVGKLE